MHRLRGFLIVVLLYQQVRRNQVDKRREQTAEGSDKCRDREPTGPVTPTTIDQTTAVTVTAYGPSVRIRPESQLFSTR